jgi:hypothetical protein
MNDKSQRRSDLVIGLGFALGTIILNVQIISTILSVGMSHLRDSLPAFWSLYLFSVAGAYSIVAESDYPARVRSSAFLRNQARLVYSSLFAVATVLLGLLTTDPRHIIVIALSLLALLPSAYIIRYSLMRSGVSRA